MEARVEVQLGQCGSVHALRSDLVEDEGELWMMVEVNAVRRRTRFTSAPALEFRIHDWAYAEDCGARSRACFRSRE